MEEWTNQGFPDTSIHSDNKTFFCLMQINYYKDLKKKLRWRWGNIAGNARSGIYEMEIMLAW